MTAQSFLLKSEIDGQIKETCEKLGFADLVAKIRWCWNSKLTRAIGRATYRKNVIDLSHKLFQLISPTERRDTIIHEVCHLIAYEKFVVRGGRSIKGHGPEWKMLMRQAGGTPKSCSKKIEGAEQLRRKTVRVTLHCKCGPFQVTPLVATRVDNGQVYGCRRCKTRLQRAPHVPTPVMPRMAAETVQPPKAQETRDSILAQIEELKLRNEILRLRAENDALRAKQKK